MSGWVRLLWRTGIKKPPHCDRKKLEGQEQSQKYPEQSEQWGFNAPEKFGSSMPLKMQLYLFY